MVPGLELLTPDLALKRRSDDQNRSKPNIISQLAVIQVQSAPSQTQRALWRR